MSRTADSATLILEACLELVMRHGVNATTTRAVAEAAGVNEVTVFRLFKDKANLLRAMFTHFDVAGRIAAIPTQPPSTTQADALNAIIDGMYDLRTLLIAYTPLVLTQISEYERYPDLLPLLRGGPEAAQQVMLHLLEAAAAWLRDEVDIPTAAQGLQGWLLLTVLWQRNGWLQQSDAEWRTALARYLRPFFRVPSA
jgi:AcrR family transcriptional regulator